VMSVVAAEDPGSPWYMGESATVCEAIETGGDALLAMAAGYVLALAWCVWQWRKAR